LGDFLNTDMESESRISAATAVASALGFAIGYGVWAAAPAIIDRHAPWEGSWPYYSTVLITASALVALLVPRRYAAVLVGTAIGQMLFEYHVLPSGLRPRITSQYDWIGALMTLPGTWIGSTLRGYFSRAA
jgi:hypothetical protein